MDAVVDVPVTVQRVQRITARSVTDDQRALWTLIDFTCPDEDADQLFPQGYRAVKPYLRITRVGS